MSDVNCPHGSNSRCDCYAAVETAAAERILAARRPAADDGAVRLSEEEREALLESVIGWARAEPGADALAAWPAVEAAVERILAARRRADEDGLRAQLDEVAGIADDNRVEALEAIERAEAAEAERDGLRADIEAWIVGVEDAASQIRDTSLRDRRDRASLAELLASLRAVLARHPAEPGAQETGHPTPTHGDHQQEDT